MSDWALLAAAITGAPSIAAVLIVGIWSAHRRWHTKQAAHDAAEAMKHEHVWGMWKFRQSMVIYSSRNPNGRPIDNHHQSTRRCETCGEIQIKTVNDSGAYVP